MGQVVPGVIAFAIGTVVAVAALVPWTAWEYRRHGRLGLRRSLVAFGTLVYVLALLTYTLLPLPTDLAAICQRPSAAQLRPFAFVEDIAREGGVQGLRSLVVNPAVAQVVLNVVLFVPLGALARHAVTRRRVLLGLGIAAGAGVVVSALIETTQLTGDWFLYPCSYRLFDVDDLITNTTGAALGSFLAPVVGFLAGSRPTDASSPRPVTKARRFSGMFSDVLVIWLVSGGLSGGTSIVWGLLDRPTDDPLLIALLLVGSLVAPTVQFVVVMLSARTLGEHVVRLRPDRPLGLGRRALRWVLGSGGWATLLAIDLPLSGVLAFLLAAATIVAVLTSRTNRGFADTVIGATPEDDRTPATAPALLETHREDSL